MDIMKDEIFDKYMLMIIDFFSRYLFVDIMNNRTSKEVIRSLKLISNKYGRPAKIIRDNAKEFISNEQTHQIGQEEVEHHKVGLEAHASNGRIERAIRTIRDTISTEKDGTIKYRIDKIVKSYNKTYHSRIKSTPEEAWINESGGASLENSIDGKYKNQFKNGKIESFKEELMVRITKKENIGIKEKSESGRFLMTGRIIGKAENNSYLVRRDGDGKIEKKSHVDL